MSAADTAAALRRLADAVDRGDVPECRVRIEYGQEFDRAYEEMTGIQRRRPDGSCLVTVELRFTQFDGPLKLYVAHLLT